MQAQTGHNLYGEPLSYEEIRSDINEALGELQKERQLLNEAGRSPRILPAATPPSGKRLMLKRIGSTIDNENGVEFIPIQGVGWPKRLVILRGDPGEWHRGAVAAIGSHLAQIDAYRNAPIRVVPRGADIELYEVEE